jgi:hypothetical protein
MNLKSLQLCGKSFFAEAFSPVIAARAEQEQWLLNTLSSMFTPPLPLHVSVDDDASGLMCTANTKTNTKQMRGV